MVNYVKTTQLVTANGVDLTFLNFRTGVVGAATKNIPCVGTTIAGAYWITPYIQGAIQTKRQYTQAINSTPPTVDSYKVLRLKYRHEEYEIAIANTDYITTVDAFATLCDGLGGGLATMPIITIPFPIFQDAPSSINPNVFTFPFPNNPLTLLYAIPNVWFNGLVPSPAYAPSGITTPAQFATWANSNWGTYGTWASSGNIVTLTSPSSAGTPVFKAGMPVNLAQASYCLDLTSFSSPTTVNGVQLQGGTTISFGAISITNSASGLQTLINAIKPFFENGAAFALNVTDKIDISTISGVTKIYNGASLLATSTAGSC